MFISSVISPAVLLPETENPVTAFLEYPEEAVVTLESSGLTAEELMYRASAEHAEYVQSGGYDDICGIFVSPYYTARIGNTDIPVYLTMVFLRAEDSGALHSLSVFSVM